MQCALIIGSEGPSVDSLEESLWEADYRSILTARDLSEAWQVLAVLHPALIVVLPEALASHPTEELYDMSEATGAPIIVATADPAAALRCLGPAASLEGPYPAYSVAKARSAAARPKLRLARAA